MSDAVFPGAAPDAFPSDPTEGAPAPGSVELTLVNPLSATLIGSGSITDFTLNQHDLLPSVFAVIEHGPGPVDLTTAEFVKIEMQSTKDATIVFEAECIVTNAPVGEVRYDWIDGQTNFLGEHVVRFEVTWPDGKKSHHPNGDPLTFTITQELI